MGNSGCTSADLVGDGIVEVRSEEVGSETLRRLVGHLDAVLKDADRERIGRVAGEP